MPKVSRGKKYSRRYTEGDLENALQAIRNGMSKKTASKRFKVPRSTLQFRQSNAFLKSRPGPSTVLTTAEENELVKWINTACRKGFPRRKENIIESVKLFLKDNPRPNNFINNTPGEGWYKLFLQRHPEISKRITEAVTLASSKVSEEDIRSWFQQIEIYLKENDLFHILNDPKRVYNGDETSFMLCPKTSKVVAPKGERNVYEVDHAQAKSCITVMMTFSADGDTTPPMLIFPLKRMRKDIFNSVPDGWGVGLSDNGWMKANVFQQYIKNVLYPDLLKKNVTFPVVLFLDGHKSHTTLQLSNLCQSLGIILIALYPNATRLLQPADVAAFRPIKMMWRKALLEWRTKNLTKSLVKTDVGPILEQVFAKINSTALKNGFRACGLCPFNPDYVDYTKCLMPVNHEQEVLIDSHSKSLDYETFKEMVGPQLIRKMSNQIVNKSKEAKVLNDIFKFLKTEPSLNQGVNSGTVETLEDLPNDQCEDMEFRIEENDDCPLDLDYGNEMEFHIEENDDCPIDLDDGNYMEFHIEDNDNCPIDLDVDYGNDYCINSSNSIDIGRGNGLENKSPFNLTTFPTKNDSKLPSNKVVIESSNITEKKASNDTDIPISSGFNPSTAIDISEIPSTSRQKIIFKDGEWARVDETPLKKSTSVQKRKSLNDILVLPPTPPKKAKNTEPRIFVLTSKEWQKREAEKEKNKLLKEKLKESKRQERLQKAEEKRVNKEKKQAERVNKTKNRALIKKSKVKRNLNSNSAEVQSLAKENSAPNVIIHSNILIKQAK